MGIKVNRTLGTGSFVPLAVIAAVRKPEWNIGAVKIGLIPL
jgi:hypothetical protein